VEFSVPWAVPRPANRLIGRERELADVRALLRTHRLVTLVGAGGSGKTRLALELLAAAADEFPDGAWWVPLQEIRDPGLVLPAIAEAVGAREALGEHLSTRAALLVLDNLEQILRASDGLRELLEAAPDVQVLATSREPLHLSLEQQYPVQPLQEQDARALFVERARQVRPGFEPDESAAELCRRLDGLPLAIELAAARVTVLGPKQMLERIQSRLPLLTGGPRDAPERQRTLRATIEWSHELLAAEERTLFAQLAVFEGGCTLDAAVNVSNADLDVLAALVDKNLVRRDGERFGMLETIQEYAAEQLARSGEEDALRDRHAAYYLALAREIDAKRHGPEWLDLLDRFFREEANTRAAFGWLLDSSPADALEVAIPYSGRLAARDGIAERLRWLEEALSCATDASARHRARARMAMGDRLVALGYTEQAAASYEASISWATEAGAELEIADAQFGLGRHAEALAEYRRLGAGVGTAMALHALGYDARDRGDLARARELLEESVALTRKVGNPSMLAALVHSLADCALDQGMIDEAARLYLEVLDTGVRTSTVPQIAYGLGGLAAVEAARGRPQAAGRLWGAVQKFERESGYLPLNESERSRYKRALSDVPRLAPTEGTRWADVLADAVAYARSVEADDLRRLP
jgi:predicted ATPase